MFIYFWLSWVFAERRFSLVAVSEGYSLLAVVAASPVAEYGPRAHKFL